MRGLETILEKHAFFAGLDPAVLTFIAECGKNVVFDAGEFIAHEGADAEQFYIIREGKVAVQIHAPDRGGITLQTIGPGEILGWSWLFPPYEWCFDIKAIEATRAVALDGRCLRRKCESDHELGYEMMKRFSEFMVHRLKATRMQVLDIYKSQPT